MTNSDIKDLILLTPKERFISFEKENILIVDNSKLNKKFLVNV